MSEIFSKTNFLTAPGGNIYPWSEADASFSVPEDGKYVITITASAKNAKQNGSTNDDDLQVSLDGYIFGKYEVHNEKISRKGFGTAAAWDGASLKGGTKYPFLYRVNSW